jgi:hypothetical protein
MPPRCPGTRRGWWAVTETCYELRVAGRLSDRACSAFIDMAVRPVAPETILYGRLTDDQLHGLLALCQNLGLQVVALCEIPSAAVETSDGSLSASRTGRS